MFIKRETKIVSNQFDDADWNFFVPKNIVLILGLDIHNRHIDVYVYGRIDFHIFGIAYEFV